MTPVWILLGLGAWYVALLGSTCLVLGHDYDSARDQCRRCRRSAEWIWRYER